MKRSHLKILKNLIAVLVSGISAITANGQKLPVIQKNGLLAPAGVKIDGDAKEWGDSFQAYNKTTHIFYTIANDDDNLYLLVRATEKHDIQKVLAGGLTLVIKNADKKSAAIPVAITYPRLYPKDRMPIVSKINNPDINMDTDLPVINKMIADNSKLIEVTGIKEFPDSLISVYNEQGIKAVALLNDKKALTYELAIPLKYLQQTIGDKVTFNYSIMLKGLSNSLIPPRQSAAKTVVGVISVRMGDPNPAMMADQQDLMETTDFAGTYTMAKK